MKFAKFIPYVTKIVLIESNNCRSLLNIPIPQIKIGEVANLTIFDRDQIWTADINKFKSKAKNSPFDKRLMTGKSIAVINKGKMFFDDKFITI